MIKIVDDFLEEYKLKDAKYTFLVGFSGGCDSLSLLDILNNLSKQYGFKVVALHLNHNWRGEESRLDEVNCKNFCDKHSIDYISETLIEGTKKSENYARQARYDFFLKYACKYENSAIFTAHTGSDNAETIIYRMIKGTGIKGLKGILPKTLRSNYPIYRPLLQLSRQEIEGYCISNGLVANTDSSNYDTKYKRNFIRHEIMPLFKEINYNAEKSIISLAKLAISESNIIDEYLNLIKREIFSSGKILTEKFKELSIDVRQKIIYDLFLGQKLDYDMKKVTSILEFIQNNMDSKAGSRYSLTSDLWIFASSTYIYLITSTKGEKNINETTISKEGSYEIEGTNIIFSIEKYRENEMPVFPSEDASFAYVNLDDVGIDLTIRSRRDGDYISPFGMSGTMKLKKYLNSKGVFQHEKDDLIMLCKGSEVLWVAGVGLSNKLKVVNKPSHVIQLANKK